MRVLLDTHAFLWFISGDAKLSPQARETIEAATTQRYLSIASLWEIVIKTSIGKLPVSWSFTELIEDHVFGNDFQILPIETVHLSVLESLPHHHRDPFDRMIIAQAITEDLVVIGADSAFKSYDIDLHW